MKESGLHVSVCILLFGFLFSRVVSGDPVTIYSNYILTDAGDAGIVDTDSTFGTTIPLSEKLAATSGNSNSNSSVEFSGNTSSALLTIGFDQSVNNSAGDGYVDYARILSNSLYFTANTDTTYSLDGLYTLTATDETEIYSNIYLQDFTTGEYLFRDYSQSYNTPDQVFILGDLNDGDFGNTVIGPNEMNMLAGNLIAGHNYRLFIENRIQAFNGSTSTIVSATAQGHINLSIGTATSPVGFWSAGPWSNCSVRCNGGTRIRNVVCKDSMGMIIQDSICTGTKPSSTESCNTSPCLIGLPWLPILLE